MAEKILLNEYKALSKETWTNISLINDNILEWSVALIVLNPDSLYYGGYYKAIMKFPKVSRLRCRCTVLEHLCDEAVALACHQIETRSIYIRSS